MSTRCIVVSVLFLGVLFFAVAIGSGNCQPYQYATNTVGNGSCQSNQFANGAGNMWGNRPYHYYHHYQYDSFPFGNAQAKDYTYDPYPQYRGYTYNHPPYYGFNGTSPSTNPYGDRWGLWGHADTFHY